MRADYSCTMRTVLPGAERVEQGARCPFRPRLVIVEALGTLTSDRYGRIVSFALANDLDPGRLLDLAVGVRAYPPDVWSTNEGRRTAARHASEVGDGSWSDVAAEMERDASQVIGGPWDSNAYMAYMGAGPRPVLRWRVVQAARALERAGIDVVVTVTCAREFVAPMTGLVGDLGLPVAFSATQGACKADGSLWRTLAGDSLERVLVIDDAWGCCTDAARAGAVAWWPEGDGDCDELADALDTLASPTD